MPPIVKLTARVPAPLRLPLAVLTTAAAYYLGARLGLALSFGPDYVAPLWPPNAILLTALLFHAPRRWPWFLLAAVPAELAADIPNGISWPSALGFVAADWVEVLVAAALLRRFVPTPPSFADLREAGVYVGCCVVTGPLVAAFPGAAASTAGSVATGFWSAWRTWAVGDALTHFALTPVLLLWIAGGRWLPRRRRRWRFVEATVLFVSLAAVSTVALAASEPSAGELPVLVYAPFPFLLWAAIRFRPRGVATAAAMVTLLAVWAGREGLGPFTQHSAQLNVLHLQAFLFLALAPLLLLAVLVRERDRADRERRDLEERLRQAEKMEAIGQLAGGIAHDFNNLLTGILGNADLLRAELPEDGPTSDLVTDIVGSASRAADLTRQLLAFSRRGPRERVPVDLHEVVREVIRLLERVIDRRISIQLDCGLEEAMVEGDASQLQNALLNLGLNARDAMPSGGEIRFATASASLSRAECESQPVPLRPGPYLRLTVSDTGLGMDGEVLARAFEPFFTTKERGQGTGLGLASVYGCVRGHGGMISVESEPDVGSEFSILLPAAAATPAPVNRGVEHPVPPAFDLEVLVIDDEEVVRRLVARALEPMGCTVHLCADGEAGVAEFAARHHELDVVVLDLVMPRMSGTEVFAEIQAIDPAVPVLVSSGYTRGKTASDLVALGAAGVLHKPFTIEQLRTEVATVLGVVQGSA